MKKTPLNSWKRDVLRQFCKDAYTKLIRKELKFDKAEEAMKAFLVKRVEEEFPTADMAVLKRYDSVRECDCISFTLDHDRDSYQSLTIGKFLSPRRYNCHSINVTGKIAATWFEKKKALATKLNEKETSYGSLIYNAKTFEDVASVLPFVETLRGQLCGANVSAVVTLNNEIREELTADNKAIEKVLSAEAVAA